MRCDYTIDFLVDDFCLSRSISFTIDNYLMQKMVASYDYDPLKQSPSKDKSKELSLRKGQYVTVIGDMVSFPYASLDYFFL